MTHNKQTWTSPTRQTEETALRGGGKREKTAKLHAAPRRTFDCSRGLCQCPGWARLLFYSNTQYT